MSRQLTHWEKIFVINIPDKELVFSIRKEFLQLNIKKILETGKYFNRYFPKEDMRGKNGK